MINIHFVKSLSRMKLAGMQTLDSLGAKEKQPLSIQMTCSFLYEYTAYATDTSEICTVCLATEGALSLKMFLSQTVTKSHIAACWNFFSQMSLEKAMLYF